tara:strand:- start:31608 stop:31805 length:198 start_codon:yes stop_codon:yes gene_type:complete
MKVINNDDDLRMALLRTEKLWSAEKGSVDADELEVLITLINDYEDRTIIQDRAPQGEIKVKINEL